MEDFFYLYMEELTLTTPALLFSAVSLILLAYTNRFLSYAQLVRQLRDRYMENPTDITVAQIENLRKRLNLTRTMQGLGSLWIFCKFFSILPYWFRYYVVEPAVFGALRLLRYRYRVVTENLRNSFPEKSLEELHAIRRGFYRTLAEIFVDTFSLAGLTDEKCRQVVVVKDLEKQMAAVEGRDWIALTAHLGCWEYCSFWGIIVPSQVVVAVYHPLRSRVFDELYKRLRSHANICPVPMAESLRFYLRNREKGIDGKNIVMGLIADQNPPRRPDSHWFRFLNRDTIFFDGGEKLALRCGLPVYCCWLRRVKPGYYEMDFDRIYDGEEEVAPHEITERYVRRLEQKIREYPDLWMWSHKRWKHKSPADLARMECERKQK